MLAWKWFESLNLLYLVIDIEPLGVVVHLLRLQSYSGHEAKSLKGKKKEKASLRLNEDIVFKVTVLIWTYIIELYNMKTWLKSLNMNSL